MRVMCIVPKTGTATTGQKENAFVHNGVCCGLSADPGHPHPWGMAGFRFFAHADRENKPHRPTGRNKVSGSTQMGNSKSFTIKFPVLKQKIAMMWGARAQAPRRAAGFCHFAYFAKKNRPKREEIR